MVSSSGAPDAQKAGAETGDHVYVRHPKRGAVAVMVVSVGKDGFTGQDETGKHHRLHHDTYLGHKHRPQMRPHTVVDTGADGFLAEDDTGKRRYIAGEAPQPPAKPAAKPKPSKDDPLIGAIGSMKKALIIPPPAKPMLLMLKAGTPRPGLTLQKKTDRRGRNSAHWVRTMKDQPHPRQKKAEEPGGAKRKARVEPAKDGPAHKHGDTISFRHGDVEGTGKVVASGKDGVTVKHDDGRESMVRHDAIAPPHKYAEKTPGEDDKSYLKRTAKDLPDVKHLPEEHERFFNMDQATATVPISQLVSTKSDAENEKGGGNAPKFMMASYHGHVAKRDPISVEKTPDGKYKVIDGNGTFTGAKAAGWQALPVKEVNTRRQDHRHPAVPTRSHRQPTATAWRGTAGQDTGGRR